MQILKTKLEKHPEDDKWFNQIIESLYNEPKCMKIDLEIIIIQAINRYLKDTIDLSMFLQIINSIKKVAEKNDILGMEIIIKKLLSLSRYLSNPNANKYRIIETFNYIIEQIEISFQ